MGVSKYPKQKGNSMGDLDQEAIDKFRGSLKDVEVVVRKMAGCCDSLEDLVGMVQLALKNDGQLRLLMAIVAGK